MLRATPSSSGSIELHVTNPAGHWELLGTCFGSRAEGIEPIDTAVEQVRSLVSVGLPPVDDEQIAALRGVADVLVDLNPVVETTPFGNSSLKIAVEDESSLVVTVVDPSEWEDEGEIDADQGERRYSVLTYFVLDLGDDGVFSGGDEIGDFGLDEVAAVAQCVHDTLPHMADLKRQEIGFALELAESDPV